MIIKEEFEFIVDNNPAGAARKVYMVSRASNDDITFYTVGKGGVLVGHKYDPAKDIDAKPLLSISSFVWEAFVRALTNDLPNVSREEIDAELKATKFHLEDMRRLVFKGHGKSKSN